MKKKHNRTKEELKMENEQIESWIYQSKTKHIEIKKHEREQKKERERSDEWVSDVIQKMVLLSLQSLSRKNEPPEVVFPDEAGEAEERNDAVAMALTESWTMASWEG